MLSSKFADTKLTVIDLAVLDVCKTRMLQEKLLKHNLKSVLIVDSSIDENLKKSCANLHKIDDRNNFITDILETLVRDTRKIIVFSERIDHLVKLKKLIGSFLGHPAPATERSAPGRDPFYRTARMAHAGEAH